MRQLMHSHRRSRWTIVPEKFTIHFVIAAEIIHVRQVGGNLDYVFQLRTHYPQNIANVLDDGSCLGADVELRCPQRIWLGAGNRIVGATRTRSRYEQKISGALD